MNVLHVDVDGLDNGLYHPNVSGFDYRHNFMTKDRELGGTCFYKLVCFTLQS